MLRKPRLPTQADADRLEALILETECDCDRAMLWRVVEVEDPSEMTALQCDRAIDILERRKRSIANGGIDPEPIQISDSYTIEMTVAEMRKNERYTWEGGREEGIAETRIDPLDEWEEWFPVLEEFRINPKKAKPDFRALARLLRSDKPLSSTLRHDLANLLEDRRSGSFRGAWQLRPAYYRERAERLHAQEKLVENASKAARTVSKAMADVE
jgi:hypothetical protein